MLTLRRIDISFLSVVFTVCGISLGVISVVLSATTAKAQVVVTDTETADDGTTTDGGTTTGDTGTDGTGTGGEGETTDTATFDSLSPGNRKIANALFDSQQTEETMDGDMTGTMEGSMETGTGWTLEQIAAAKQDGSGWGQIFKQMKADGLIAERNLGQVISGQGKTDVQVTSSTTATTTNAQIVITSGHGQRVMVNLAQADYRADHQRGGNAFGADKAVSVSNGHGGGNGFGAGKSVTVSNGHGGGVGAGVSSAAISSSAGGSGISHGGGQGGGKGLGKIK